MEKEKLFCLLLLIRVNSVIGVDWGRIRCASDPASDVSEGIQSMGKFPWLGIIQHNFEVGGVLTFAVTSAILIHPGFAIAPAEDMSKIRIETISNTTKLILWHSASLKYAIDIVDYILHPEYTRGLTSASMALVELRTYGETGLAGNPKPVLPICITLKGSITYTAAYAAKMSDENKELQKELFKMNYVDDIDCTKYYNDHQLNQPKMAPSVPTCAIMERAGAAPCVWDAGVALVTKETWNYWTLVGFGARGPGCGAPSRFLSLPDYLPWINDLITPSLEDDPLHRIGVRSLSPYELLLYDEKTPMNPEHGQCDPKKRGGVIYKEYSELTTTKSFAYGFYFIAVSQIASFSCCIVKFEEALGRSIAGVWIEHNCHKDPMSIVPKERKIQFNNRYIINPHRHQCFMYFKSTAFIEFRFFFSFSVTFDVTLFGKLDDHLRYKDPFGTRETTSGWYPTDRYFYWSNWQPKYLWL